MFQFADKYRGPYSNGLKPIVCPFYCSYSGYQVNFFILLICYTILVVFRRMLNVTIPLGLKHARMSYCGVLLGCTRPPKIQPTLSTSKLMDRFLVLQNMTTPSGGTTSMLEQEFFFPRSSSNPIFNICLVNVSFLNLKAWSFAFSQAFLVQKLKSLHDYKGHADNFICSIIPGAPFSSTQYTPGPLTLSLSLWSCFRV